MFRTLCIMFPSFLLLFVVCRHMPSICSCMRGMRAEAGGESKLETPIKGRANATEAKFSSLFHFFTQMHFHAQFSLLW